MTKVAITLTRHEALVLFEWLAENEPRGNLVFHHPSEEKVVWKIQGQLESCLSEPFAGNYAELVSEARRSVESDSKQVGRAP